MTDASDNNFTSTLSFEPEPISTYDPKDNSQRRAFILLALTFGGLLLSGWLVLQLYLGGTRDRDTPPVILADNTPFKVEPVDPGGDIAPNQDLEVFSSIDGSGESSVTTAPEPEQPLTPPADELPDAVPIVVEPVVPVVSDPEPVVVEPEPEPVRVLPSPEPVVPSGNSQWVVQVASLRSEGEAQATYDRIARKFSGTIPGGARADIVRADLGDKGIYFRARVAGLADKAAANRLCEAFKAGNQACFVTR